MRRGSQVRLVRDGTVIYTGEIATLRRVNDDVVAMAEAAAATRRGELVVAQEE